MYYLLHLGNLWWLFCARKHHPSLPKSNEYNKSLESDPKEIETLEYLDFKDFKMIVLIMLKELKQNMDRQVK